MLCPYLHHLQMAENKRNATQATQTQVKINQDVDKGLATANLLLSCPDIRLKLCLDHQFQGTISVRQNNLLTLIGTPTLCSYQIEILSTGAHANSPSLSQSPLLQQVVKTASEWLSSLLWTRRSSTLALTPPSPLSRDPTESPAPCG